MQTQLDKSINSEKNTLQDFLSFPDVTASVINVNKVYKVVKQIFIVIVNLKKLDIVRCSFFDNAHFLMKQYL